MTSNSFDRTLRAFQRRTLRLASIIAVAAIWPSVAARSAEEEKNDMDKLAGVWTCVSAINDGKTLPDETVKKLRLTLTEDKYKTERGEQVLFDSTYATDRGKTPKQIDIVGTEGENKGKAAQGIYSLDGEKLTICYTMPGKERPKAFESKAGSAATLVVWQRSKP
jgi:uncharacterized protein (TIGR03067 family)